MTEEIINEKQKITLIEHIMMRDPQTGKEVFNRRCPPAENYFPHDKPSDKE